MQAAGVPEDDWSIATDLIHKESSWNPSAVNAESGACGLAQELPCGKSGCNLGDGVCQVSWQHRYVVDRYGSYAQAMQFWLAQWPHWY